MKTEESTVQSRIEMIEKINTAIHLGKDDNYKRAIHCMEIMMKCRSQIAQRCRDFNMPDENRDLYYELLEQYSNDIRKLLGL